MKQTNKEKNNNSNKEVKKQRKYQENKPLDTKEKKQNYRSLLLKFCNGNREYKKEELKTIYKEVKPIRYKDITKLKQLESKRDNKIKKIRANLKRETERENPRDWLLNRMLSTIGDLKKPISKDLYTTTKIKQGLKYEDKKLKHTLFKPKDFLRYFSLAYITNNIEIRKEILKDATNNLKKLFNKLEIDFYKHYENINATLNKVVFNQSNKDFKACENMESYNSLINAKSLKLFNESKTIKDFENTLINLSHKKARKELSKEERKQRKNNKKNYDDLQQRLKEIERDREQQEKDFTKRMERLNKRMDIQQQHDKNKSFLKYAKIKTTRAISLKTFETLLKDFKQ